MPSPRTLASATLTVLILGGGGLWISGARRELATARQERDTRHALRLELERDDSGSSTADDARAGSARPGSREALSRRPLQLARDLLATAAALRAARDRGEKPDPILMQQDLRLRNEADLLGDGDLKAFIAALLQQGDPDSPDLLRPLNSALTMLADRNPEAALAFLTRPDSGLNRQSIRGAVSTALKTWALRSPEKAAAWLDRQMANDPDFMSEQGLRQLVSGLASSDPSSAVILMKDRYSLGTLMDILLNAYVSTGSEIQKNVLATAKDYLQTMPGGETRDQASTLYYQKLSQTLTGDRFEQASAELARQHLAPLELSGLLSGLTGSAYGNDLEKWTGWILTQAPAKQLGDSFTQAMTRQATSNTEKTVTWALQTPDPDARRIALDSVVQASARMDPERAEKAASLLPPGETRTQILQNVYQNWHEDDPQGKAAFATRHGLE